MFQSLWNVAAAFCSHEEITSIQDVPIINHQFHFGHHQATSCQTTAHEHIHITNTDSQESSATSLTENKTIVLDDHQDHLPSMLMVILVAQKNWHLVQMPEIVITPSYTWQNIYQSPDLSLVNPPPEFSPLMVG